MSTLKAAGVAAVVTIAVALWGALAVKVIIGPSVSVAPVNTDCESFNYNIHPFMPIHEVVNLAPAAVPGAGEVDEIKILIVESADFGYKLDVSQVQRTADRSLGLEISSQSEVTKKCSV